MASKINTRSQILAHTMAIIVIVIWASTFVSAKILLNNFSALEIMLIRILIAYIALWLIYPHRPVFFGFRQELLFIAAGICGVTLYFLMQNIAIDYSTSSNVSIIISLAPIITALFAHLFLDNEKLSIRFFIGFLVAVSGVLLVSINGKFNLKLNPIGDMLAFLAACSWAMYCVIMRKIMAVKQNLILCTRKVFFYGLVTMSPVFFVTEFNLDPGRFTNPVSIFNLLFLGLGASAFGFIIWNRTVETLGAVKTSVYLYLQPVVTVSLSAIVLGDKIMPLTVAGIVLTLVGLILSENKNKRIHT